ncbi:aminopeptidase P family protein [Candidatus Roizmanbacteria bacterium]|nr:aminopeptidase P family protein [Candidatus Roizmanbacteria bacterium]
MLLKRIAKLRRFLKEEKVDAVLISNFYNVLYLTGFKTLTTDEREAFAVVTQQTVYLLTDARYVSDESQNSLYAIKLVGPGRNMLFHLAEIIKKESVKAIVFEAEDMTFLEYQRLQKSLKAVSLIPKNHLLMAFREIKDQDEIEKIHEASRVADRCLAAIAKTIRVGQTEKEIAFRLEFWLKKNGYETAFAPIVAADGNASVPHYDTRLGYGIIKDSSVILIDFGAKVNDYLSDMTRMVYGQKVAPAVLKDHRLLQTIQEEAVNKVAAVKNWGEIDSFCRQALQKEQIVPYSHSTGHGVGLEIHELPKVYQTLPDRKNNGQIVTIEPGIYYPGRYGLRIEDTLAIVGEKAQRLTAFPKAPLAFS